MKSGEGLPKGICFPISGKLSSQKENSSTFLTLFSIGKIDSQLGVNLCVHRVTCCATLCYAVSIIF
jgi:hypothetical protein